MEFAIAASYLRYLKPFSAFNTMFCHEIDCTKLQIYFFPAESIFFSDKLYKIFNVDRCSRTYFFFRIFVKYFEMGQIRNFLWKNNIVIIVYLPILIVKFLPLYSLTRYFQCLILRKYVFASFTIVHILALNLGQWIHFIFLCFPQIIDIWSPYYLLIDSGLVYIAYELIFSLRQFF